MELQCRCTACSATFRVSAAAAGKKARCPKCTAVVDVPTVGAEVKVAPPPAPIKRPAPPVLTSPAPPPLPAPPRPAVQAAPPPPAPQPAAESPPKPAVEFPAIVTSSAKAAKKKDLQFSFPEPGASDSAVNASVLPDSVPASPSHESSALLSEPNTTPSEKPAGEFVLGTTSPAIKSTPSASPSSTSGDRPGKKKKSGAPLLIGGGVLGLLVVVGAGLGITAMLGGFGGPSSKTKQPHGTAAANPSGKAILILDWPELERSGSALSIDGKRMALPTKGEAKYTLPPGAKKLLLQRRGYENVETTLSLTGGETSHYAPKWDSIDAKIADKTKESGSKSNSPTGTNFPVGGAAPSAESSPPGFPGWYQLVETAQRQAKSGKKELFIVFGVSDADAETKKLAQDLAEPQTKAAITAAFVPVIIDLPQTAKGHRYLEDAYQNQTLAQLYGIRKVPVLVLADEQGHPYFIEREWKSGMNVAQNLTAWKQKRGERDQLLTAARAPGDDATRMAAAEKALNWLKERQFISAYADDVRAWIPIAQRVDATNSAGKLEAFVEADLQLRIQGVRLEDETSILQAIAPLNDWTGKKRFLDPDRGASLHLLAAAVLIRLEKQEEGVRHLNEAATYEPKNKELKDRLAAAKDAIKYVNIASSGTGFVISEAGYLLTNHHVVEGDGKVVVQLKGVDQPLPATIIAEDANKDMALIKIEPPPGIKLSPISLANSTAGRGASVIAFGYPLQGRTGQGVKLTEGVVSALPEAERNNMFLLDMRINPGNSGGPLCDNKGNVIGMVTAKTGRAAGGIEDTYGMAIPSPDLLTFLERHLPKTAPAVPPVGTAKLSTEEVDTRVSPAVMLILKMK
ncbi:MAG: trypsin-like peptidase domain-containing protein [Planctomycetales bacterium]|nr:trypsin-like peptidase domain-containing protein [Planctomycetales bacterium]